MASSAIEPFSESLKKQTGISLSLPSFEGWDVDTRELHRENDLGNLLNLPASVQNTFTKKQKFYYPKYSKHPRKFIPMTIYGDSFNVQWERALMSAGVIESGSSFQTHNQLLSHKEVYDMIERGGILSLGYGLANLTGTRIGNEAENILKLMQKPYFESGFYFENDAIWLKKQARMKFLVPKHNVSDFVMTTSLLDKIPLVNSLTVSLNNQVISVLNLANMHPNESISVKLPQKKLLKGEINQIVFYLDRTAMPVAFNINTDTRPLGVKITMPTIQSISKKQMLE